MSGSAIGCSAIAKLVGIDGGVVSEVIDLDGPENRLSRSSIPRDVKLGGFPSFSTNDLIPSRPRLAIELGMPFSEKGLRKCRS
jgi:hypothetical protein